MLKILFVEDEESAVTPVITFINREQEQYDCGLVGFADAEDKVAAFQPDILILDLCANGGSGNAEPEGNKTLEFIWKSRFCPVVIFSAHPDFLAGGDWIDHPFVKMVKKGIDGNEKIEEALKFFVPHVKALRETEDYVRHVVANAMRDVARYAFRDLTDANQQKEAILRSGRRRIAAHMDHLGAKEKLASWEAYIFPPIDKNPLLGDVIRLSKDESTNPASFRIVLTPSCDLAAGLGRKPKVEHLLAARCCSVNQGIRSTELSKVKLEKLPDALMNPGLTQGYFQKIVFIPSLTGRIPAMTADLKALELIPVAEISTDTSKLYTRVASLDSPFRELISWAYMQTACRPGLPDRDCESWSKEIMEAYGSDKAQ